MSSTRRYDLLRSRLDRFTRTLPGVESGEIGAVHRARVASRRLREILPVLGLEQPVVRKLGRRLRKLTRRLGSARDLDVLILLVDELRESGRLPDRARSPAWRWAVDARVSRRASTLKAAIGEAGAVYLPERIHRVRLALKKLRYGVELATETAGIRESSDLATLKRGQELLGRVRDLQV